MKTKKQIKKKAAVKKTAPIKKAKRQLGGTAIRSFEDACKFFDYDPNNKPIVNMLPACFQEYIVNHYEAIVIIAAINSDKKPDWNNWNEKKHYPWPLVETKRGNEINPSGFGFSSADCNCANTHAAVGSRQTFRSEPLARHFFETFPKHYKINQLFI